jgi:hypothetical protein
MFSLNIDPRDAAMRLQAILLQNAQGQRTYGVGTGGEGWGVQAMYDPQRKAAQISGGMQRRFAEGGSVDCGCLPGYAEGGLRNSDDPNQWLQFGGQDTALPPAGLPIGQAVATDVGYHFGSGLADAFKLANQAYEGELPPDYFQTDEGVGRALNAAMTPMLGSFGLSHAVGPTVGAGETMLGMAVKPKGGNWLANSVEGETRGLKSGANIEQMLAENEHYALEASDPIKYPREARQANLNIQENNQHIAIDNWVDKKLNKYIKNEMGTPEDPIRPLAERDILHIKPELMFPTYKDRPGQTRLAQSNTARAWEDVSDRSIVGGPAKNYFDYDQGIPWAGANNVYKKNPWLEKVSPETTVYEANSSRQITNDLGFDHLVDELKNAVRHDSDLPTHLRLTPEKLEKVSVPQAVELVAKINKWREEAAANALAKNATNDATHLVKEYPEAGYKWVELKPPTAVSEEVLSSLSAKERELFNHYVEAGDTPYEALQGVTGTYDNPALAAALKYEGDMMGHCVGGYCGDVESGRSRIFSLRDSKGRPHVTIETGKDPMYEGLGNAINKIEPGLWEKMVKESGHIDYYEWLRENRPDVYKEMNKENVIQVKGKGNMAPKEEYLPFVQDFIKAGKWRDIHDLHNTGLYKVTPGQRLPGFAQEIEPGLYTLDDFKKMAADNEMPQEIFDMWMNKLQERRQHGRYARGGSVQDSHEPQDLYSLHQKYAEGGPVLPSYDPMGSFTGMEGLDQGDREAGLYERLADQMAGAGMAVGEPIRQAVEGISDVPSSIARYLAETSERPDPSQRMAEDIQRGASGFAKQAMSSPTEFAKTVGGFLPGIGEAISAYDAKHLYGDLQKAEAEGDMGKADTLRQLYGLATAGAIPGIGMGARVAGKVAKGTQELRASTRFPTGKSATENPLLEQLTIGPAEMRATPTFEHNMGLLSEYPGFAHLKDRSPEEQLAGYMEQARDNLNFLYENAPAVMRERSPAWYNGANNFSEALSERYGIPRQSSSAAIAALSPQMDWFKNASLAERVGDVIFGPTASTRMTPEMESFQRNSTALTSPVNQAVFDSIAGKRFSDLTDPLDQALWIRLYDEVHNARNYRSITPEGKLGHFITNDDGSVAKVGWGSLNEIEKAVRAYTSGGDMNVISPMLGTKHKVRSFYNNIELPDDLRFGDVTADTHAVAASQLRPLSGNTPAVAHNLASGLAKKKQPPNYVAEKSSAVTGVQGTYGANAEATRMAAADQGLLPRQMQSATWEPVRELFPREWKTPKNVEAVDNIWREKDAGNLTAEQARNAIFELAGGFNEPAWAQRGPAPVDPRRGSTYR